MSNNIDVTLDIHVSSGASNIDESEIGTCVKSDSAARGWVKDPSYQRDGRVHSWDLPDLEYMFAEGPSEEDTLSKDDERLILTAVFFPSEREAEIKCPDFEWPDYLENRTAFCKRNIQLSLAGHPAPIFRFPPALPGKKKKSRYPYEAAQLARDLEVIDLHWLYTHHRGTFQPKKPIAQKLFSNPIFDPDLAYQIAEIPIPPQEKVCELGVDAYPRKQLELWRLHGKDQRGDLISWVRFHKGIRPREDLRGRLQVAIQRSDVTTQIDDYLLWFSCLRFAAGSPTRAAKWYQLATGKLLRPNIADHRKKQLERWLNTGRGKPIQWCSGPER